jgi:hypothetical protein
MQKISSIELINRERQGLPTLIIDAREEIECLTFEVIDPRNLPHVRLDAHTYGGKRMMQDEVKKVLATIKKWSDENPTALVAVSCTRMINYCPRIAEICSLLTAEGIEARGIDPHLYDFFNARMQRKLNKVVI